MKPSSPTLHAVALPAAEITSPPRIDGSIGTNDAVRQLRISGLSKSFRGRRRRHAVFEDFSLSADLPGVVVIRGPNGCGKSTLLRMLAGLITPDSGRIDLGERHCPDGGRLRLLYGGSGPSALYGKLTVEENLRHFTDVVGARADLERRERLLRRFALSGRRDDLVETLSKGNQQKVILVRSLAISAELVLLDEPSEYLDDDAVAALVATLGETVASGSSVVLASHDQRLARIPGCVVHTLPAPPADRNPEAS